MKRQGQKRDLTSVPLAQKFKGKTSREILGEQVGESQDQIRRYIRLTELIPEILEMVDNKKISMRPAVDLSYLPKEEQEILYDTMESEACTPSHAQAIKIRKFSAEGRLNEDVLLSIMSEEKSNQVEQWKIPKNRLKNTFHRELHSRKWKKPLSKHWNYTGNGKKAGNDSILTPREKSILLGITRNQSIPVFPSPHPTPLWFTSRLPAEKTIRSRELFLFRQVRDSHTLHDSRE